MQVLVRYRFAVSLILLGIPKTAILTDDFPSFMHSMNFIKSENNSQICFCFVKELLMYTGFSLALTTENVSV